MDRWMDKWMDSRKINMADYNYTSVRACMHNKEKTTLSTKQISKQNKTKQNKEKADKLTD